MHVSLRRRVSVLGAGLVLTLLAPSIGSADEVTLQNGRVLHGKVMKSGATVTVTNPQGTRIVLERSSIRKIEHGSNAVSSSKPRLTDAEKTWFSKVRQLIRRVQNSDPEASARALRDLRAINDPAALPALMQTLRTSDFEASRLLYVRILGDMPGSKAVVGLVEEALFDSSELVREAAQEASKKQRPQFVRPYYGQALRFPNRDVVSRAASVLSTVGDKENVPGLIDSLYSKTLDVALRPSCCMSRAAYLAYPPNGNRYGADNLIPQADRIYSPHHDHLVPTVVVRDVENPQVKDALEAITKQSFGYNAAAWRRWWKSQQLADRGAETSAEANTATSRGR